MKKQLLNIEAFKSKAISKEEQQVLKGGYMQSTQIGFKSSKSDFIIWGEVDVRIQNGNSKRVGKIYSSTRNSANPFSRRLF